MWAKQVSFFHQVSFSLLHVCRIIGNDTNTFVSNFPIGSDFLLKGANFCSCMWLRHVGSVENSVDHFNFLVEQLWMGRSRRLSNCLMLVLHGYIPTVLPKVYLLLLRIAAEGEILLDLLCRKEQSADRAISRSECYYFTPHLNYTFYSFSYLRQYLYSKP